MNIKKTRLYRAYCRLTGKNYFKNKGMQNRPIVPAFICNGVQYYKFHDIFSLPCERGLEAVTYYQELQNKVSKEYLQLHVQAVDDVFSDKSGTDLQKLAQLNLQLKERLDFIIEPDIVYKLASVVYFDDNENPYRYDMLYNLDKIKKWKNNEDATDFFLRKPIKELIGFGGISKEDLNTYIQTVEKVKSHHFSTIGKMLSPKARKSGFYNLLKQQGRTV